MDLRDLRGVLPSGEVKSPNLMRFLKTLRSWHSLCDLLNCVPVIALAFANNDFLLDFMMITCSLFPLKIWQPTGIAGLASLVVFKSTSKASRVGLTMFGLGIGVGDALRFTSTKFDKEKNSK